LEGNDGDDPEEIHEHGPNGPEQSKRTCELALDVLILESQEYEPDALADVGEKGGEHADVEQILCHNGDEVDEKANSVANQ
jgi:general stress protein YciG